jgi:hypothetical protein
VIHHVHHEEIALAGAVAADGHAGIAARILVGSPVSGVSYAAQNNVTSTTVESTPPSAEIPVDFHSPEY